MKTLTEKELKKLLKEERTQERIKQKRSKFLSKTCSIYNGQKRRAIEMEIQLDYTLDEFREFFEDGLSKPCPYSGDKLSLSNVAVDHMLPISRGGSFGKDNLVLCTSSANFQKGILTHTEFRALLDFMNENFDVKATTDLKKRLTTGGKFISKKY